MVSDCRRELAVSPAERGGLRQAHEDASRFVTADGEIDGQVYRAVLRARRLVTIKGIGETYSGLYYVGRVRHSFAVRRLHAAVPGVSQWPRTDRR